MVDGTKFQEIKRWTLAWTLIFVALIGLHWWQDELGDDRAWIWICSSMGNRACGPGEPWIRVQVGGAD